MRRFHKRWHNVKCGDVGSTVRQRGLINADARLRSVWCTLETICNAVQTSHGSVAPVKLILDGNQPSASHVIVSTVGFHRSGSLHATVPSTSALETASVTLPRFTVPARCQSCHEQWHQHWRYHLVPERSARDRSSSAARNHWCTAFILPILPGRPIVAAASEFRAAWHRAASAGPAQTQVRPLT